MWDLDNLKYINDTYGHDHGDRYIQKAASILNEFTIYNAIVARMSGDEFYTFIYGYKEKEEIRKRIKEIQTRLYNTLLIMPDDETLRIRASAGIAWYPEDSKDYDELVKYSDFTMYEIKSKDKGNIGEFNKANYNKDSILLHGKEELNHFIDQELVKYAFQPIVEIKTGKVFAYEALMRPQTKKLSSPLDVIRLAQSQSKLYEIERLTWFKAMECFEEQKEHFGDTKIFINSIPSYVLSKQDLEVFEKKFSNYLSRIVIEITENEQSNEECTKIKQETAARWGSHLALDDFGSGYNSEVALLVLSPKFVKIDMTIVQGIDTDENRQKLLSNIISYAKIRDIKIIAEGVESKAQMSKLIEFGVDYMQGHYLGKPQIVPQEVDPKLKSFIQKELSLKKK
ncbi:MAG TPA: bifunctional diguanylate cyclase/phosphodiesterase, partial [Epulopiscium sp.]|nr:bifunctional diguanylate cyclase/phosphodiesterase [Candidatus Epulonipiscium sp.]